MRDHLWIALWAVAMTAASLAGVFVFDVAAFEPPGESPDVAHRLVLWITVETGFLLIAAALLRGFAPWARSLAYFALLGALALLFGYDLGRASREIRWHVLSLASSAACMLAVAVFHLVRRAKPVRESSL
jgi:hypothetical protein